MLKRATIIACILAGLLMPGLGHAAGCVAASVQICVSSDDESTVWLNGTALNGGLDFPYTPIGNVPLCVSFPLGLLNTAPTPNVLAVKVYNSACCHMQASWSIDVACSNTPQHVIATNNFGTVNYYDDVLGSAPPAANWTDPAFTDPGNLFTDPFFNSFSPWMQELVDPATGTNIMPISYASVPDAQAGRTMYFRQIFTLNDLIDPYMSPTASPTSTWTATTTPTATPTVTPTITHTSTITPTYTATLTATPSPTFSHSPTISPTFTFSPTFTITPTITTTSTPVDIEALIEKRGTYPNPFENEVKVFYLLKENAQLRVDVFNVAGERIYQQLWDEISGSKVLTWKGENSSGARAASGIYLIRVQAQAPSGKSAVFFTEVAAVR